MQSRRGTWAYRVLSIGRDVSLMSSRANLLTHAGYVTDFVLKPEAAIRRISVRHYQVVVVSDAFSRDEQLAIRARIHQVHPRLPVLQLQPEHGSPAAFLAAVDEALRPSEKPHTGLQLLRKRYSADPGR